MSKEDFSLFEFLKKYPNEESAKSYFEKIRWNDKISCPYCKSDQISLCGNPMSYRCKDCRKHFSVRTNSILAESRLPLQKWLLAMYILTVSKKGISSIQLAKHLGCTQKTAWFLAHMIREAWVNKENNKLNGTGEVDETYIGGLEKNKHSYKKLKQGAGAVGKIPVFSFKQRDGKVKALVVEKTNTITLTNAIRNHIEIGTNLYTDRYKSYKALKQDYNHQQVKHSVREYVNGMVHTNGIESFWAILKRGYYGVYHYMSPKHLHRYLNEFSGRFNLKNESSKDCINSLLIDSTNKRLTYKRLTHA